MPETETTSSTSPPRRRADAERSIARILDAAIDALGSNTDASMAEIASRAGVVRATIYVHFPTREALLEAVTERAISEATAVIQAADPEHGEPSDALARVVAATWRTLGRYHALIAINTEMQAPEQLHAQHGPVFDALAPLIQRGQADGAFRADVTPEWHLSMLMALVHAASGELRAGRVPETEAEGALVATILGAVTAKSRG